MCRAQRKGYRSTVEMLNRIANFCSRQLIWIIGNWWRKRFTVNVDNKKRHGIWWICFVQQTQRLQCLSHFRSFDLKLILTKFRRRTVCTNTHNTTHMHCCHFGRILTRTFSNFWVNYTKFCTDGIILEEITCSKRVPIDWIRDDVSASHLLPRHLQFSYPSG